MRFGILGPLEVTADGRPLALGGARARDVLATMLVHANRVVPADQLVDELWPKQPADRAPPSLQVRLSELRKSLRSAEEGTDRLVTRPPGYLLRVEPGELDAGTFEDLTGAAAAALAAGRPEEAIGSYDDAWHRCAAPPPSRASMRRRPGWSRRASANCGSPPWNH